ncbi:MAG: hypothetical protein FWE33_06220 [Defluviitaleaceae bacterium]|nr:hypothetical protein [Defluviitaleaceae bacterium]
MSAKLKAHWVEQIIAGLQESMDDLVLCDPDNIATCGANAAHILVDFTNPPSSKVSSPPSKPSQKCVTCPSLNKPNPPNVSNPRPHINKLLGNGKSLILLNVQDPKPLSDLIGFGITGQVVIIRPYEGYMSIDVLCGEPEGINIRGVGQVQHNLDGGFCFTPLETDTAGCHSGNPVSFDGLCVPDQIRIIVNTLATDFVRPAPEPCCVLAEGSGPGVLPRHQASIVYVNLNSTWSISPQQLISNSVVYEVSLIASYNPAYKYLRVRTLGAGFNPTNGAPLTPNSTYDRGYVQTGINIHLDPESTRLTMLSTDPKNINGKTTYTSGSSFTVGVNISENPGFNPSYTISESETREISDFNIYNNTAGIKADWDYKMSMIEKDIWEAFRQPFMKKGQVKEMPTLATRNLQTVTDSVWYAPNSFRDTINFKPSWKAEYHHFWVTGNWTGYTMYYSRFEMHSPAYQLSINFDAVYA